MPILRPLPKEEPNIFNYATSELSQDAIICYILEWAKTENKVLNKNLHILAIAFLDSLFNKFNIKPKTYEKIIIKKQYGDKKNKIDILCVINDKFVLLIEDKTNTKNHSDQLKRYVKKVELDFKEMKILPIYFKTGDQSNYDNIIKNKYKTYLREDFLKVLNLNNTNNDIVENYKNYLQNIDNAINSYKILEINHWRYNSWKGFFITLKEKLGEGNWKYVSNARGGFLGFWWNLHSNDDYNIYLQIDHNMQKITVKLSSKTDTLIEKSILNQWKKHIPFKEEEISFIKPKVVRSGKTMTIGILENEFRITDDKNIIDIDKTITFIKEIEKIKLEKFSKI